MKLFYSPTSPFVRKVMVVAHEVGLADRLERLPSAASPVNRDQSILAHNPLAQVPTLLLDDGQSLADSRVICEYLDHVGGGSLFPKNAQRWRAITEQAVGDGLLGAALLARYEGTLRPEDKRWPAWRDGQIDKVRTSLAFIEERASSLGERVDIGTITFACALSYLDLRYPDLAWRDGHPAARDWFARFDERPSMRATPLVAPA